MEQIIGFAVTTVIMKLSLARFFPFTEPLRDGGKNAMTKRRPNTSLDRSGGSLLGNLIGAARVE
jgi:hypothetical protein